MGNFAIMICIDKDEDDWIFVTEPSDDMEVTPIIFDSIDEAYDYADDYIINGNEENVKVVQIL